MTTFILIGMLIALFFMAIDIKRIKSALYNTPMGISQWMNHGKKYGYWEYFEDEDK